MNTNPRQYFRIMPTVTLLIMMLITTVTCVFQVNKVMRENCLTTLEEGSMIFANEINHIIRDDKDQLNIIATVLGGHDGDLEKFAIQTFPQMPQNESFSRYNLLFPDNSLLIFSNGQFIRMKVKADFDVEVAKAPYVSNTKLSQLNEKKVIYQASPVVRNGETIAVLYGVTELSRLPRLFPAALYNGQVKLFLVDGDTGDMLMNTMNGKLVNIYNGEHPINHPMDSADTEHWFDSLRTGARDHIIFNDSHLAENFYASTVPTNINAWRAIIIAPESAVFSRAIRINNIFRILALLNILLIIAYAIYLYISIRKDVARSTRELRRMSMMDEVTQLLNRNVFEKKLTRYESSRGVDLWVVYIDANGLRDINNTLGHSAGDEMLRTIGANIKAIFGSTHAYRLGGDEFIIFCTKYTKAELDCKIAELLFELQRKNYSIAVGTAFAPQDKPLSHSISEAEGMMYESKRQYYSCRADKAEKYGYRPHGK